MNVGEKVVCVDASINHKVHDFCEYPDGFISQGTVYVIKALGRCGGVQVIGCRTIFMGTENYWNPKRFRLLDEIRKEAIEKAEQKAL